MAASIVLDVIHKLSVDIGPRLGGSEQARQAREYLAELLSGHGFDVTLQPFTFVGWEYETEPRFELLAPAEGALTCAPMAFSSDTDGVIEGKVWRDGSVPVIPFVFEYARFALGDGRQREASILVPPAYGPAYSLPNIRPTFQEPAVYISKSDADRISAHLDAGEEVRARLQTFGHHVPGMKDANVIARLPGESDERIVVGSHYDSVWKSPGAIDNASGVAVMTEVALRAAGRSRRRSLEFISFGAEEWWLFGSEYFVEEAVRRGEIGLYRAMLNCDPLGRSDSLTFWMGPDLMKGVVVRVLQDLGIFERHPVYFTGPHTGSDHYPFWLRGVPVCFPIFLPHTSEYHQPSDTIDLVDPSKLATIIDIVDALATTFDTEEVRDISEMQLL